MSLKFTREGKHLEQFGKPGASKGRQPDDADLGPFNPDAPPAQQFRLPHDIAISRDGLVYAADCPNNRIQVFRSSPAQQESHSCGGHASASDMDISGRARSNLGRNYSVEGRTWRQTANARAGLFGNRVAVVKAEVRMRNLVVATVALVVGLSAGLAGAGEMNPAFFGTWKLNTEKSKADTGQTPKSQTVTLAPRGDRFVVTFEVDNGDGTRTRTTRTAALDGQDVVVEGISNPAAREAYTSIDARTIQRVVKLNGQIRNTLKLTLAPDGKTVATISTGTGADGKPFHATSVLDKQEP